MAQMIIDFIQGHAVRKETFFRKKGGCSLVREKEETIGQFGTLQKVG